MEETTPNASLVRAVGVIDENKNFIPYGSTAVANGIPVYVFNTKEEYDEHAPTLPEPCMVITLDDIDTGGFEFDSELSDTSENAVQNKVIAAALEALRDKANFERPGMVQFTDATDVTDRNSGLGLSAIERNSTIEGSLANLIKITQNNIKDCCSSSVQYRGVVSDFNSVDKTGFYRYGGAGAPGAPIGSHGILLNFISDLYRLQVFFCLRSDVSPIYVRSSSSVSGDYDAWREIKSI